MPFFRRKKQGHSAPQSATSAVSSANSVPRSGFTFVDNSKGALEAIQEVSEKLDEALIELECQGTLRDQLQQCQEQLDEAASHYANSSLDCCSSKEIWPCDRTKSDILSIAWKCAAGSYDPSCPVHMKDYDLRPCHAIKPSLDGTIKSTVMTIVEPSGSFVQPATRFPLMVVAIRGSGSVVDHMVNLNISPRSTEGFISPELDAHAGFLAGAMALESEITRTIEQAFHASGIKEVLFAGHSAGAAVASILFMHYRVHGLSDLPIKFSSITFGGPPALRPARLEREWNPESEELWLNVVNEYDVIARADKAYILSLVDLLRSVYRKLPLENTSGISQGSQNSGTSSYWALQESEYRHYGDMIVLQVSQKRPNLSGESVLIDDGLSVSPWKVSWADYSQLLFTRIRVHARTFYERSVGMIAEKSLMHEENPDTEGRRISFG